MNGSEITVKDEDRLYAQVQQERAQEIIRAAYEAFRGWSMESRSSSA